ncbi:hypothetical protein RhiirA4_428188 [Rhizophagus irregularis]|uniref:Uncharacterized protein n=1 Tax=Rhizophagus irregularis TaxID=588596 RepID=A0A2I1HBZ5_9GLOM|nr:hypothetical protein RhiirA4_428188 [Rhizophagus irregularis]
MSNMGDSVGTLPEEDFLKFISAEGESFLYYTTFQLGQFVENGFLKNLFDKNPPTPVDKAQLLVDMFGESANPNNFAQQAAATNIQPTTLSLIFSIALYASSRSWDYFATRAYTKFGDMGTPQVFPFTDNVMELKWCRHSLPNLKKAPNKPKAKNVTDKKSGQSGQQSVNVNLKKKGPQPSTSAKKQAKSTKDPLKDPKSQKSKSNKKSRDKGGSKVDNKELELRLSLRSMWSEARRPLRCFSPRDDSVKDYHFYPQWAVNVNSATQTLSVSRVCITYSKQNSAIMSHWLPISTSADE